MKTSIRFSAGSNMYDNCPKQMRVDDFGDLVEHMETCRGEKKGEHYVCGPMSYGPHDNVQRYPRHACYRLASHAEPCSFLSLDIDYMAGAEVQQLVLSEIEKSCAYAYETSSSRPDLPRMRVMIELDRVVERRERIALGHAFEGRLKAVVETDFGPNALKFDPSVYRPEQPNYNPLKGAKTWNFVCDHR